MVRLARRDERHIIQTSAAAESDRLTQRSGRRARAGRRTPVDGDALARGTRPVDATSPARSDGATSCGPDDDRGAAPSATPSRRSAMPISSRSGHTERRRALTGARRRATIGSARRVTRRVGTTSIANGSRPRRRTSAATPASRRSARRTVGDRSARRSALAHRPARSATGGAAQRPVPGATSSPPEGPPPARAWTSHDHDAAFGIASASSVGRVESRRDLGR